MLGKVADAAGEADARGHWCWSPGERIKAGLSPELVVERLDKGDGGGFGGSGGE